MQNPFSLFLSSMSYYLKNLKKFKNMKVSFFKTHLISDDRKLQPETKATRKVMFHHMLTKFSGLPWSVIAN